MLKNFLLVSFRNIWRNKAFSIINIMGLVVGISAALMVYLVVHYENSFDRFEKDGDHIYRVVTEIDFNGDIIKNSGIAAPVAGMVANYIPAAETVAPFFENDITGRITVNGKDFKNGKDIIYADKNYFSLIPHQWLAGSPETSLQQPFKVVLTSGKAAAYFPGLPAEAVLGKEIIYDDTIRTTVSGIVADLQYPSDFANKEFISLATLQSNGLKEMYSLDQWNSVNASSQLLVKLNASANVPKVTAQLTKLKDEHRVDDYTKTTLHLQALRDIHFNKDYTAQGRPASLTRLYALGGVALALLLLAGINFINLTTAQAARRARETGIRKSLGSSFPQLITQFLSETLLLTLLACILSALVTPLLIVAFHSFLPVGLTAMALYSWQTALFLAGLCIAITLLAGIYPAMVLARFEPVAVLKTQVQSAAGKLWLRKTLTVSQFVVAQVFIIATIIVSKQVHFSLSRDPGFRKDAVVTVRTPFRGDGASQRNTLQEKWSAIPEIAMVSQGGMPPLFRGFISSTFRYHKGDKEINKNVEIRYGDSAYAKLYDLKFVAGRNLRTSDTIAEWVLNEKAVTALGFRNPQDVIGEIVQNHPVVGVVKNFYTSSTRKEIPALAIASDASRQHRNMHVLLRAPGENSIVWKHALEKMEKAWKEVYPRETFSYNFLDKSIEALYEEERRTGQLLNWCAGLAFFISALGLLGLVIFTTNQRTREIGIRKVLGASVWQMVTLLTSDFMKLVGIAFVLAIPLSWWAMQHWLSSYAYRTPLSWWVFAAGGGLMAILALATMSIKTIRAALSNPVNALKSE
ncbi:ABC-type antimicrobial peptide transport system, permease component [Chitinophaga ginsengisegetis]|uniref:ABC-type antimicrobial peptide transport system, permease component n=1 Tax=Chitinophaga ginsengisegetis TaxID=393003 RepID=A0A1T5P5G8_9BACT|nr:ABC transporter permease [Chitinophaga ginsengisegetis]SKD08030.1 ABC-type antimicrobial peptide transport system, permease component [Chitinophaga ginsengisegetis]